MRYEDWIDLSGIALVVSYSEYHCSIPRKSCICALISRIPLSDTEMVNLRVESSDLGVYCTNILELMHSKDYFDNSLMKF